MYIYQRIEIRILNNVIVDLKVLDAFEDPYLLVENIDETYENLDEIEFEQLTDRISLKIKAAGPIFYKRLDKENECLLLMSKNKIIKK
ncbi:hypothetical protein [Spiroplasma diminutum]|uniref:Uncharacterized protein n=1 Tax=Spiroplasma diminutum CUAS-1 TaxID=1276221 RepID=S5M2F8_9MOLU|nr:hypothetical protein [Spiroplasma diminutum]AGR42267.1 hypothetical protein SDIMI_v3c05630 [Spiroplasma diminutum CUAS-1]